MSKKMKSIHGNCFICNQKCSQYTKQINKKKCKMWQARNVLSSEFKIYE